MVELGLVETTEDEEDGGTDALGWSETERSAILLGQGSHHDNIKQEPRGSSHGLEENVDLFGVN